MGNHNSLSAYADLFVNLYQDLADGLCVPVVERTRDIATVRRRVLLEGISFITIYLPSVGKAFDKALLTGHFTPIPGLKRRKGTNLPSFLGSILSLVFQVDGRLSDHPNIDAIKAFRQLAAICYKLEMPVKAEKAQKAIDAFIQTEQDLKSLVIPDNVITVMAQRFTAAVFGRFDPYDIMPKHGPGAVADGELVFQKHSFRRMYAAIERVYPFSEYYSYSLTQVCAEYHTYEALELRETGTAKVVLVPKDSRGPRIISCEPVEYQWIQQGLGTKFRDHLEQSRYTKGHVNFTDQTVNRNLALAGSLTQDWVTLDMKEASDRVSTDLVKTLFALCPQLLDCLLAVRTTATRLPDGTVLPLKKFAPMGSNLCFPVEAFVFYALAVSAVACTHQIHRREAAKMVYVYGDDLIIRREVYAAVLQRLPEYGLMFNQDKCCTSGFFRESCGCDAYKGVDVTPLRMKKVWSHRNTVDIVTVASHVAISNAMWSRGYYRTASMLKEWVEAVLGPLPIASRPLPVSDDARTLARQFEWGFSASGRNPGVLSWIRSEMPVHPRDQPKGVRTRFNRALQRWEVFGCQPKAATCVVAWDDWSTVLRRLNASGDGAELPGVYALPHRSYPKWGWTEVV